MILPDILYNSVIRYSEEEIRITPCLRFEEVILDKFEIVRPLLNEVGYQTWRLKLGVKLHDLINEFRIWVIPFLDVMVQTP